MSIKITLVRHGKADKTSSLNHRLHNLSEVGRAQARERREKLGNPQFDLVLHSILPRAQETARLVAGIDDETDTIEIPGLYMAENDPRELVIDKAFEKLGYASLELYLIEAEIAISSLVMESQAEIERAVRESGATDILIVGHAVLLQALGKSLTGMGLMGTGLPFNTCSVGECGGFRFTIEDFHCPHVSEIDVLD